MNPGKTHCFGEIHGDKTRMRSLREDEGCLKLPPQRGQVINVDGLASGVPLTRQVANWTPHRVQTILAFRYLKATELHLGYNLITLWLEP